MKKAIDWKAETLAYSYLVLGCLIFAVGDVMFVNPYLLAPGGTYGLSNVLNTVWPWKISYYAICMDIPLLLIGTWILGPKFGAKTVVSTILIFIFTWILETFWGYEPVIHNGFFTRLEESDPNFLNTMVEVPHSDGIFFMPDYFLNTLVAGGIYGLAIGLVFKSGATSGGSDIICMILHKYIKVSLGTLVLIVDSCITLTSFIAFRQLRLPIYSILLIVVESKVIDLVVDGLKNYKTAFIVTDEVDKIREFVINNLERGGTILVGSGLYQGAERKMIYISLNRADLVKLKASIRLLDPNAFVNVVDSSEILGNGFKSLPE